MVNVRLARLILSCGLFASAIVSQAQAQVSPPITTSEIVQRLVLRNQQRALTLKHYSGMRHYQLDYHGFPSKLSASMTVVATYDAPGRKEFQIVSQSGSALLRDSVFSKLLKTEKEASDDINRQHTLVDPENYNFKLVGLEDLAGRPAYVLEVDPRFKSKFLYRGKIWVDATDFAVAKILARPAVNPSFWTKQSDIDHTYAKVGEFWLPARNKTVSRILFGGTATLTIDYSAYDVAAVPSPIDASSPDPVSSAIQTMP